MPWYIRFAKVPELLPSQPPSKPPKTTKPRPTPSRTNQSTLPDLNFSFEIRNDLGESLYPGPASIAITVQSRLGSSAPTTLSSTSHLWTGQSWTTSMRLPLPAQPFTQTPSKPAELRVVLEHAPDSSSATPLNTLRVANCADLAYIYGTTSAWLPVSTSTTSKSPPFALRQLPGGLQVWEGTGSSIAAHVWDAGMVLCGHLVHLAQKTSDKADPGELSELGALLFQGNAGGLRVLELGAGCGISGLVLGQQFGGRVAGLEITDQDEAMELVRRNVAETKATKCSAFALDWASEADRSAAAGSAARDLILVSDCTYNVDAVASLVTALKAVAKSDRTLVAVALKRRHDDEEKFFHEMKVKGFVHVRKHAFQILASEVEVQFGVEPKEIELHMYRLGSQ